MVIYCDGADLETMRAMAKDERVEGFTTNPSLMKKAGVTKYREFAEAVLDAIGKKPVSFEVFADDFKTMEEQAREIASWGDNVYVKIPVTNTLANPAYDLIWRLARSGVKVNVTAIMTAHQGRIAVDSLDGTGIVSIFAGRIADTGVDPTRAVRSAKAKAGMSGTQILWASAREIYNVVQAQEAGADIITLSPDLIGKLSGFGRNLMQYSLETVKQFHRDAEGYAL